MSEDRLNRIRDRVMKGSLTISAGAGTGKTYTLIESYQAAVKKLKEEKLQRIYDKILAITFTNAATYEFKKRIQDKVVNDRSEIESYLTSQEISTIHSACQRMLQNLALEVGLNPSTEVLEEGDDFNLACEVLESVIREELSSGGNGVADLLSRYDLRGFGYQEGLRNFLFSFHSKTRTLSWSIDTTLANCRKGLDEIENVLKLPPGDVSKWLEAESLIRNAGEASFASLILGDTVKVSRWFLDLYEKFAKEFDKRKRSQGLVSHDDSLYYAHEALENLPSRELIREYYRSKYKMMLVDEYQDTDPLQDKIIDKIANPEGIYRVGDVKQSIFRFRRADPAIFQKRVSKSDPLKGEIENLTENRRSRKELVNFTNYLFSQVFNSAFLVDNGLGGVSFEPMTAVREPATGEEELEKQDPVEVYKVPEGGIVTMCTDEAEFIASRILRLMGTFNVYRKGEDNQKPSVGTCEFKDIAILFRTKTHPDVYLDELTRNSIPYVLAEAPGFFEQPEIGLALNCLRFLNEPGDNLMKANILRSPAFCLSDPTLLKLARNSYRLNPEFISTVSDEGDKASLLRFLEMDHQLQNSKSLPKRDLIQEILKRSGLDLIYLTAVNGAQAYANLMKLLDMASGFDKEVNGSLNAFLNWIDNLDETTEQSQAQVYDDASNAVKIFTIHKAKGLEFPVVFVPLMFREFTEFPYYLYVSEESELDLPPKGPTKVPFLMKPGDTGLTGPRPTLAASVVNGIFGKLMGTERLEDVYEEWRLLYVAFTRARDLLVFSICQTAASKAISRNTKKGVVDLGGIATEDWNTRLAMLVNPPDSDPSPPVDVARITWHDAIPETNRTDITSQSQTIPRTTRIDQKQVLPRLSATDFADYEYCPKRYYYARVLGLRQYERHTGKEEESRSSQEEGSKLHEMLEAYDFVSNTLPKLPRLTEKEKEKLMPLVKGIAESDLGKSIGSTPSEGQRREFEFSTLIEGVQFISRIDLALRGKGGDWRIFDYKSGDRTQWSLALYKKQVSFYARLFESAIGVPVTDCSVVYADIPKPDIVSFKPEVTIDRIKSVVAEIEMSNFTPKDGPEKCKACPYSGSIESWRGRWVCKEGWVHVLNSKYA